MKKLSVLLLLAALCIIASLSASNRAIWVNEDFSGNFPPTGWTISSNSANWDTVQSGSAGGSAPEVRFSWEPQFTGSTYLISPQYDTTGETTIYLDYNQYVDWYATPFTVGVATRSGGGAWNVAFSQNPTANVGPQLKTVSINNADVGSSSFQFAIYFSGSSYNIDYWYIDNVKLYTPFPYDLGITDIPGPEHVEAGTAITPICEVKNLGMSPLTATVSLDIYQGSTMVNSHPDFYSQSLSAGATVNVSFPSFTPAVANELYRYVFSVGSLEDVVDGDLTNNTKEKTMNTWTSGKQNVLLEIGTGGWCPYCPGAAMAADHFVEEGYNVAVIENHNGDPYATDTSDARNAYYGISGFPTGVFDGLLSYVGGNNSTSIFPSYLPLYQQRADIKTPISLSLYGTNDALNYSVYAQINKLANLAYDNLVLHVAITQSHIPYNWQGQTEFNFVNMLMVPDVNGTIVDLKNAPLGVMNIPLNFTFGSTWDMFNSELVVFVQNLDTKEVLQTYKVALLNLPENPVSVDDGITPVQKTALHNNFPNPFNPETTIRYSLKEFSPVSIGIYNVKGQLVKTLIDERKAAGDHSIVWNGTDDNNRAVGSGVYYFKMYAGKFSSTKKMILLK
ncbi:MAG: FlgD immunoglobulin-like domain containing protein [Candidatus Cloacimonetes bacterium]|nr:FlgD immunoglobulin-like domain containing protein [Candidatus Cloacimonadota bacterium]